MTVTRLTAGDWVDVGFAVLGADGIQGVKIDRMAERLGVTKGSFYWHFRDLDDFLDALAAKWAGEMGTRYLATAGSPDEHPSIRMHNRLRVFLSQKVRSLDREMRAWARKDGRARAALERTDRQIYDQITADLRELGFGEEEARWRASVLFYASIGYAAVDHPLTEADLRSEGFKLLELLTARDEQQES
ncbi:MAG TPA: TetR/AcrR family transcriptional regulator [Candidatus Dormibacteraeota bacterium]|nr:TetR/AcrR family transcriptional regulator [Candidatus Dormibacteraeota bacterium]